MMSPVHNDVPIASSATPVHFNGFTISAGRPVVLECHNPDANQYDDPWTAFHTVYSSNEAITWQGETIYPYTADVVVPRACWYFVMNAGSAYTEVRSVDGVTATPYYSYNADGIECLYAEIGAGSQFYTAAAACSLGFTGRNAGLAFVHAECPDECGAQQCTELECLGPP